jgi:hypothetical protein
MKPALKDKRISLRLDVDLYSNIAALAKSKNLPKSKIFNFLINNLDNKDLIKHKNSRSSPKINYNFYIDPKAFIKLKNLSRIKRVTITDCIKSALNKYLLTENKYFNIKSYHDNKSTEEIWFLKQSKHEKLSFLIRNIESFSLDKVEYYLDLMLTQVQPQIKEVLIEKECIKTFIKAIIEFNTDNIALAKELFNTVIELAHFTYDRFITGVSYRYLAEIEYKQTDTFNEARVLLNLSLENLHSIGNLLEIARTYILIGYTWNYSLNNKCAENFYRKARVILERFPDSYLWAYLHSAEAYHNYYSCKELAAVKQSLESGLALTNKFQLEPLRTDFQEKYMKVYIFNNELDNAYETNRDMKIMYSSRSHLVMANSYKLYIQARHDFRESINTFTKILETGEVEYPLSQKCVYAATKYVYGDSIKEKEEGELLLKQTIENNSNNIVGQVAGVILRKKRLVGVLGN